MKRKQVLEYQSFRKCMFKQKGGYWQERAENSFLDSTYTN